MVVSSIPRGYAFTRLCIALMRGKGMLTEAAHIAAESDWTDTRQVELVLRSPILQPGWIENTKAAVAVGTTTDATWASALVQFEQMVSEFVSLLRPLTILGRIAARQVPFNVRYPRVTGTATIGWLGQGISIPASALSLASDSIGFAKLAGIIVLARELVEMSSPAATEVVQNELLAAVANFLDQQFISPNVAAVSNVSPASVTNGIVAIQSGGSTAALLYADFGAMIAALADASVPMLAPAWIISQGDVARLSAKTDTAGSPAFPNLRVNGGGTLCGIPVIPSNSVQHSVSAGSTIVLLDAAEINVADEGLLTIDTSDQASVQIDDAPGAGAQNLISLWQNNLAALRIVAFRNWKRRQDAAVAVLDNVHL